VPAERAKSAAIRYPDGAYVGVRRRLRWRDSVRHAAGVGRGRVLL